MLANRLVAGSLVGAVLLAAGGACGGRAPSPGLMTDSLNKAGSGRACLDSSLYVNGCPANTPPQRLVLNPLSGIPNAYIVMLRLPQSDVDARSAELATKYAGQVTAAWTEVCGFSLKVADSSAPALAAEPDVCWVEQDAMGGVDGVKGTP